MRIRRVVTGVDKNGKSVILSDDPAPHARDYEYMPGQGHTRIWQMSGTVTTEPPADEPTTDTGPMLPAAGGASFLILQIAPDSFVSDPRFDPQKAGEEFTAYAPDIAAAMEPDNPGMHQTRSVDYAVVLDGEVYLELDDNEHATLSAGDTIVQLGSRHAWRNKTNKPATLAVVLTGLSD